MTDLPETREEAERLINEAEKLLNPLNPTFALDFGAFLALARAGARTIGADELTVRGKLPEQVSAFSWEGAGVHVSTFGMRRVLVLAPEAGKPDKEVT